MISVDYIGNQSSVRIFNSDGSVNMIYDAFVSENESEFSSFEFCVRPESWLSKQSMISPFVVITESKKIVFKMTSRIKTKNEIKVFCEEALTGLRDLPIKLSSPSYSSLSDILNELTANANNSNFTNRAGSTYYSYYGSFSFENQGLTIQSEYTPENYSSFIDVLNTIVSMTEPGTHYRTAYIVNQKVIESKIILYQDPVYDSRSINWDNGLVDITTDWDLSERYNQLIPIGKNGTTIKYVLNSSGKDHFRISDGRFGQWDVRKNFDRIDVNEETKTYGIKRIIYETDDTDGDLLYTHALKKVESIIKNYKGHSSVTIIDVPKQYESYLNIGDKIDVLSKKYIVAGKKYNLSSENEAEFLLREA